MKLKVMAAAAAIMALGSSAAMAQPGQGNPMMAKMREACGADMQKYCADKLSDRDARRQCMTENAANFSDTCKAALAEMRAAVQSAPKPN